MSHFDRYHSMKPVDTRWGSLEQYHHKYGGIAKDKLLKDAREAIAWGNPDNESIGMSSNQLISVIRRLVNYIETT